MSTQAGTLGVERRSGFGSKEWAAMLVIGALSVTALVMSVVALQRNATRTAVAPRHAAAVGAVEAIYEQSGPVTGTGLGLTVVADASILRNIYQRSQSITGSGPALAFVADRSILEATYQGSAPVTGTGPDLVRVADRSSAEEIYRNSGPVTGTGPGLQHLDGGA